MTKSCTALNDAALLGVKELGKMHFFCAMTVWPENSEIGSYPTIKFNNPKMINN